MKTFFGMLLAIFTVSVTLLLLFFSKAEQGTIAFEAAKALLQLGVVAVVGAGVSWAAAEHQRKHQDNLNGAALERQRYEYRDELLTTTLRRVVLAYANAKKARRLLRAHIGLDTGAPGLVGVTEYDRYLEVVNDAQLELESVKGDVTTSALAFSNAKSIENALISMEQYLGRVVKEYEKKRHLVAQHSGGLHIGELADLSDFLGKAKDGNGFKESVINPYHVVQGEIRNDLLYPKLPRR